MRQRNTRSLTSEEINAACGRVLRSREFKGSARMRSFLSYVVAEALAGRSDEIRAKTIAMDVYGYSADDLSKREGVVRVDAGRVRRKLKAYYNGDGATDPVGISLPVGNYTPEFRSRSDHSPHPLRQRWFFATAAALGIALVIFGLFATAYLGRGSQSRGAKNAQGAIHDVSPARVEAMNLCKAGRDLIFPVVDQARLQPALLIFKTAVERDPHYFGGYAGSAQVETMLAMLQFADPVSGELLKSADKASAHALELAPDAPWALSARAWLEFGLGNYNTASSLSVRAVDLAPNDPHIAEFDALISLYTSNYDRILSQSGHYEKLAKSGGGQVFGNALGAAWFHTGNYVASIRTFEDTIAHGGPFGPISTAYLMAAHWENGEHQEARRLARVYQKTWPGFPLEAVKKRAFADSEPVDALITAMKAASSSEPDPEDRE